MDTKDFVQKIESLAKERIRQTSVVELDSFRSMNQKQYIPCILVIDDDPVVRSSLERLLEKAGYKVLLAEDARELARVIEDRAVDLIILDIGLPWINGFELAEMMKENRDLNQIPLIFLSGKTDLEDVKRGFAVGASDYIKKPFDIHELLKTVKTLLDLNS